MLTDLQLAILGSIHRLHGATPGEVAADLAQPVSEVIAASGVLASLGYLKQEELIRSAIGSADDRSDAANNPLELTRVGALELPW